MFDTINKNYCDCGCEGRVFCKHHPSVYPYASLSEKIAWENVYNSGFYEGKKAGYLEAEETYKIRFRTPDEHELFAKKLKEAIKPLEELLKEIQI